MRDKNLYTQLALLYADALLAEVLARQETVRAASAADEARKLLSNRVREAEACLLALRKEAEA